jgi:hypothetical protein
VKRSLSGEVPQEPTTQGLAANPSDLVIAENVGFWQKNRNRLIIYAAGLVTVGLGATAIAGGFNSSRHELTSGASPLAKADLSGCQPNEISLSNVSYPGQTNEILPSYTSSNVANSDGASKYSEQLFKSGPLGTKIDPGAEATIYAFMGYPATSNGVVNEEQYSQQFQNAYNSMTSGSQSNREKAAQKYCTDNAITIGESVGYSNVAIGNNANYTKIVPKLNASGHIDGITTEHITSAHGPIAGITYKTQNNQGNSASLNSFYEVVVESNGTIDIMGPLPQPESKPGLNKKNNKPIQHHQHAPASNKSPQNTTPNTIATSGTIGTSGAGGSSPTETKGHSGGAGTQAEGTHQGQSGVGVSGPGGKGPGKQPTSTSPSTTTEVAPPPTTTTTTEVAPPPTTTTTTEVAPPPTTTTTTTQPYKGPTPTTIPVWGGQ